MRLNSNSLFSISTSGLQQAKQSAVSMMTSSSNTDEVNINFGQKDDGLLSRRNFLITSAIAASSAVLAAYAPASSAAGSGATSEPSAAAGSGANVEATSSEPITSATGQTELERQFTHPHKNWMNPIQGYSFTQLARFQGNVNVGEGGAPIFSENNFYLHSAPGDVLLTLPNANVLDGIPNNSDTRKENTWTPMEEVFGFPLAHTIKYFVQDLPEGAPMPVRLNSQYLEDIIPNKGTNFDFFQTTKPGGLARHIQGTMGWEEGNQIKMIDGKLCVDLAKMGGQTISVPSMGYLHKLAGNYYQ